MSRYTEEKQYVGLKWIEQKYGVPPLSYKEVPLILTSTRYEAGKIEPDVNKIFRPKISSRYETLNIIDNLIIALNYERPDFFMYSRLFASLKNEERSMIQSAVMKSPHSCVLRKLGFLYELFSGDNIPIGNVLSKDSYCDLIDKDKYTASAKETQKYRPLSEKWKVHNNTLGDLKVYSPLVKIKDFKKAMSDANIYDFCMGLKLNSIMNTLPPKTKESVTKVMIGRDIIDSFEIEGECIEGDEEVFSRVKNTAKAVKDMPEHELAFTETRLCEMQNKIASKSSEGHYRDFQNAIGGGRIISYLPPKPEQMREIMDIISSMKENMAYESPMDIVIAAAVISISFVLMHPFPDGNGRTSRLIFQDILHKKGFSDYIIPISSAVKKKRGHYMQSLEVISSLIMRETSFEIIDRKFHITDETKPDIFRYPDLTPYVTEITLALNRACIKNSPVIAAFTLMRDRIAETAEGLNLHGLQRELCCNIAGDIMDHRGELSGKMLSKVLCCHTLSKNDIAKLRYKLYDLYIKNIVPIFNVTS